MVDGAGGSPARCGATIWAIMAASASSRGFSAAAERAMPHMLRSELASRRSGCSKGSGASALLELGPTFSMCPRGVAASTDHVEHGSLLNGEGHGAGECRGISEPPVAEQALIDLGMRAAPHCAVVHQLRAVAPSHLLSRARLYVASPAPGWSGPSLS